MIKTVSNGGIQQVSGINSAAEKKAAEVMAKFIEITDRDHTRTEGAVDADVQELVALVDPSYFSLQAKGTTVSPDDELAKLVALGPNQALPPALNFRGTSEIIYRYTDFLFSRFAAKGFQTGQPKSLAVMDDGTGGHVVLTKQNWRALNWESNLVLDVGADQKIKWGWLDESIPNETVPAPFRSPDTSVNAPMTYPALLSKAGAKDQVDLDKLDRLLDGGVRNAFADPSQTETLGARLERLRARYPDLTVRLQTSYEMNAGHVIATRQVWSSAAGGFSETNDVVFGANPNKKTLTWAWADYGVSKPPAPATDGIASAPPSTKFSSGTAPVNNAAGTAQLAKAYTEYGKQRLKEITKTDGHAAPASSLPITVDGEAYDLVGPDKEFGHARIDNDDKWGKPMAVLLNDPETPIPGWNYHAVAELFLVDVRGQGPTLVVRSTVAQADGTYRACFDIGLPNAPKAITLRDDNK